MSDKVKITREHLLKIQAVVSSTWGTQLPARFAYAIVRTRDMIAKEVQATVTRVGDIAKEEGLTDEEKKAKHTEYLAEDVIVPVHMVSELHLPDGTQPAAIEVLMPMIVEAPAGR
jgi:hypothetical protein